MPTRSALLAVVMFTGLSFVALPAAVPGAEVSAPRHEVLAADKGQIVRYAADGSVLWKYPEAPQVHRIEQLPNGHFLTQESWTRLVELDALGRKVWSYDAGNSNGNAGKKVEVHGFQRLPNGNTMLVENGIGRIIEINREGQIQHELRYQVERLNPHRDVRQAYKLESGNYLLCHELEGRVTEYAPDGTIAWEYRVPLFGREPRPGHGPEAWGNQVFNARRLPGGNTLIATGNGHSVLEVTPEKELVWELHQRDLPGIVLAWTTTLEVLPNGNLLIGNCHAGIGQPQLLEVTRDKQVVWTFYDWENLGDATAAATAVR